MSELKLEEIDKLTTMGAWISFDSLQEQPSVLIVTFDGKLDAMSSEGLFVQQRAKFREWFARAATYKHVVFNLYSIEYINSLAIGHLCQFYLSLYRSRVRVTVSTDPSNPVHDVLDYCGFFEMRGMIQQEHPISEGINFGR